MRPDQTRSVDYGKEYSSKSNNGITKFLTAGINGIAKEEDLYPTYESESEIKISSGVAIKDNQMIHIGANRSGDNWNEFIPTDVIIDLTDENNYIQSRTNPSENVFDMPGYWPTDSTASRAYIVLTYQYIDPDKTYNNSFTSNTFTADGIPRPPLSEQEDLIQGVHTTGDSPRFTPTKSTTFSDNSVNKTRYPGARIPKDQPGVVSVYHSEAGDINTSDIDWISYHLDDPGVVASIKILKDPRDFDPEKYVFIGMVFFKEKKKIINPVMVYDYLLGNPYDPSSYINRKVFNFVQPYDDNRARSADVQNFIINHAPEPTNLDKLIITGLITDSPPGKITFRDAPTFGSYINEQYETWSGTPITITHNFEQYLQIQVLDATTLTEVQAIIIQGINSFTVAFDDEQSTPFDIIIRF